MTYLLPSNVDYSNFYSKVSCPVPSLFNDLTVAYIKTWTGFKIEDIQTTIITTTTHVAMTALTCAAITYFSKMVALGGAIAVSAIAYNRLARMAERSERELLSAMFPLKIIKNLSAPKLSKETLTFLRGKSLKNISDLGGIRDKLLFLSRDKTDPKNILKDNCNSCYEKQDQFNKKISYLEKKLQLEDLKERSYTLFLEGRLDHLSEGLDLPKVDALLEDQIPLINDSIEYINDLQSIKKDLDNLEEKDLNRKGLPLKSALLEKHNKILTNAEELHKGLQALQTNRSFFKEHKALFQKITNIFQEIDVNAAQKRVACRNFMFYSITGTLLLKLGRFLKVASDANFADAILINQSIGNPYLIMGLAGLAAIYAVKNALNLIAHRNDETRKQELLATVTENERKIF